MRDFKQLKVWQHAQAVAVSPDAPSGLTATRTGSGKNQAYELTWTDNSKNETAFVIQKSVDGGVTWHCFRADTVNRREASTRGWSTSRELH